MLITDEQSVERETQFLEYKEDNILIIKSNLSRIVSHYLKAQNKFVACKLLDDCAFCKNGNTVNLQFNYWVNLNGKEGLLNIKPSVFYAMNAIEKASKKDKRDISWLVIKSGSGMETKYTVSKNENLDEKLSDEELEANNKKLEALMKTQEDKLNAQYKEFAVYTNEDIDIDDITDELDKR